MLKIISILFILLMTVSIYGQTGDNNYRIFDANGNPANFEKLIEEIGKSDAVFLGEQHDDAVAHSLQLKIFTSAYEKYGGQRKMILSMEMFERDVQIVLDEYLKNQISETHFLSSSRAWGNYKTDYRPLIEFTKEKNLQVIAANAPRRYVNMVSRLGRDSLKGLSPEAKKWIAPIPFAESSEAYSKKFNALMGSRTDSASPHNSILASQTLWDATMAYSIAEKLKENENALIVHLNGSFHTENRLGTIEHLLKYSPKSKSLVVTMRYDENFANFDKAKYSNLGDFVILTDAKVPRSQR